MKKRNDHEEFNRHPNAEDEERASVFARKIIEEAS